MRRAPSDILPYVIYRFRVSDMADLLVRAGATDVTEAGVRTWIHEHPDIHHQACRCPRDKSVTSWHSLRCLTTVCAGYVANRAIIPAYLKEVLKLRQREIWLAEDFRPPGYFAVAPIARNFRRQQRDGRAKRVRLVPTGWYPADEISIFMGWKDRDGGRTRLTKHTIDGRLKRRQYRVLYPAKAMWFYRLKDVRELYAIEPPGIRSGHSMAMQPPPGGRNLGPEYNRRRELVRWVAAEWPQVFAELSEDSQDLLAAQYGVTLPATSRKPAAFMRSTWRARLSRIMLRLLWAVFLTRGFTVQAYRWRHRATGNGQQTDSITYLPAHAIKGLIAWFVQNDKAALARITGGRTINSVQDQAVMPLLWHYYETVHQLPPAGSTQAHE